MFNKKLKLEIVELEERVLQLEKRLEEYRRDMICMKMELEDNIYHKQEEINELEYRIEKLERRKRKSSKE